MFWTIAGILCLIFQLMTWSTEGMMLIGSEGFTTLGYIQSNLPILISIVFLCIGHYTKEAKKAKAAKAEAAAKESSAVEQSADFDEYGTGEDDGFSCADDEPGEDIDSDSADEEVTGDCGDDNEEPVPEDGPTKDSEEVKQE